MVETGEWAFFGVEGHKRYDSKVMATVALKTQQEETRIRALCPHW